MPFTREILSGNRVYYVRTDGNDNNTGLSNDSNDAFLTIQMAVNTVCFDIDIRDYSVTIQVADGAYNAPVVLGAYMGSGAVSLLGNTTTPSNVTIALTSGDCIYAANISQPWTVSGFKLSTSASGAACLHTVSAKVQMGAMEYGAAPSGYHILADYYSYLTSTANYTISGSALIHLFAINMSIVNITSKTITLSGTPAFSTAFVNANFSLVVVPGDTFSGAATGPRYLSNLNGIIYTNGAGATYLPGNAAGSTATQGQYL